MARGLCVHCNEMKTIRKESRLCYNCYNNPSVRHQYVLPMGQVRAIVGKYGLPLPEPTRVAPGERVYVTNDQVVVSNPKLEVLVARAAAGQQLFHPADARPDMG